ncbi:MAG: hypothetical protein OZSIB_1226 [Candidatus Ozemobacter sibiricus]|jgi:HEAT repeat protein|uniref:HEAT repeat domain-containing protein n=1 Tax=Candidatus Ozemobacter sibiricus TaxID=2268124 RepID=A0A367ZLR9_9BACT|nr:MAG: hypothetical protein OZSIB_1226 [Candidatus Ozemobacter sibiricus]
MTAPESKKFAQIIKGLSSRDREEKLLAIRALGILRVPEHAELLIDLLGSNDELVVTAVLQALGHLRHPKTVKYLLEFLPSENRTLAATALEALSRFSFSVDAVLDQVLKAAGPEQPAPVRQRLMALVGTVKDPRVSAFMCEVIGQTKDPSLLVEAVRYFVRYPSADRSTILRMLCGHSQWEVSLLANLALSRLGDDGARAQWKRLLKAPAQPIRVFLLEALNLNPVPADREAYEVFAQDPHPQVRRLALGGLRVFSAEERVRFLHDGLTRERDEGVRAALLEAALQEKHPSFYPEFLGLLTSSVEAQKRLGMAGLSAMGEQILPRLLADLPRLALVVKEKVLLVLGNIGGEKARQALLPFLGARERWLRINAVEALAATPSPAVLSRLVEMLKHEEDIWVKASLLSAVARLGSKAQAPLLLEHLQAKDARVRANAVEGLWRIGAHDQAGALQPLLHDPNDRVRVNAAIALWKMGHREVLGILSTMLREGTKWVRSSAAFALGEIGDKEATPALLELLSVREDVVYRNVLEALGKIGDLRALIPLLREQERQRVPEATMNAILERFTEKLHQ